MTNTGAQKTRLETNDKGMVCMHVTFDDGSVMALVLGHEVPDFQQWLASGDERKARAARYYITLTEGLFPPRKEHDAWQREQRQRAILNAQERYFIEHGRR